MANIISLNTAQIPTITQFEVNTPTGLFDFLAQKSGSSVTVTDPIMKAVIKSYTLGGFTVVVET